MNELNPAEQAAAKVLLYEEGSEWAENTTRHIELAQAVVVAVHDIIAHEVLTDASERVFAEGRSKRDAVMAGKSTTSLEYIEGFEDAAERVGLYADRDRAAERQAEGDGTS